MEEEEEIELELAVFEQAELTGLCFGSWTARFSSSPQESLAVQTLFDCASSQLACVAVIEGGSAPIEAEGVKDIVSVVGKDWHEAIFVAERVAFEGPGELLDERVL